MERTREQTRGRIAFILIGTLVAVVLGTIAYMTWLTTIDGMTPEEVINLMQGLGTTLLAPIVGLIGAVIGFYYGGQAAVQGTHSAAQAATEVAKEAATTAANKAAHTATETVKSVTQDATQAATQAAEAAQAAVNHTENSERPEGETARRQ
jgi:hypothetical protein